MKQLLAFTALLAVGYALVNRRARQSTEKLVAEVKSRLKADFSQKIPAVECAVFVGGAADVAQLKAIASTFRGGGKL